MDQKIRIGVVGGNFGEVHIQGFRHCPEVEVAAVCRRQEELAKTMAQKYQIQQYYTHFQEMMEAAELDAVSLAVPNDLHYPMAVQALENSKHVICEKPLALTVKEAETMLTKAEKTKRIHTIVFDLRFVPAFIRMKELIEQGEVGTIFHVFFSWLSSGRRDQESSYTWRHTKEEAGFGSLGDVGVHGIDLIHWMTGDFKKVVAEMAVHVPKHRTIEGSYRKTEVEDSCSFVGELVNGAQVLFQASSVASCESTVRLEIHGDQGNLLATLTPRGGDYNGRLFGGRGESRLHKELPIPERLTAASVPQYKNDTPYSLFFAGVARRFVESIESGQPLSPSFRDGVKAQKVLQSLTESWEQRGWSHIS